MLEAMNGVEQILAHLSGCQRAFVLPPCPAEWPATNSLRLANLTKMSTPHYNQNLVFHTLPQPPTLSPSIPIRCPIRFSAFFIVALVFQASALQRVGHSCPTSAIPQKNPLPIRCSGRLLGRALWSASKRWILNSQLWNVRKRVPHPCQKQTRKGRPPKRFLRCATRPARSGR